MPKNKFQDAVFTIGCTEKISTDAQECLDD